MKAETHSLGAAFVLLQKDGLLSFKQLFFKPVTKHSDFVNSIL